MEAPVVTVNQPEEYPVYGRFRRCMFLLCSLIWLLFIHALGVYSIYQRQRAQRFVHHILPPAFCTQWRNLHSGVRQRRVPPDGRYPFRKRWYQVGHSSKYYHQVQGSELRGGLCMTEYCSVVLVRNSVLDVRQGFVSKFDGLLGYSVVHSFFFGYVNPVCIIDGFTGIEFEVTLIWGVYFRNLPEVYYKLQFRLLQLALAFPLFVNSSTYRIFVTSSVVVISAKIPLSPSKCEGERNIIAATDRHSHSEGLRVRRGLFLLDLSSSLVLQISEHFLPF